MHKGDGFFSKASWKKPFSLPTCLVQPWSDRPVLTFGKHPYFTGLTKVLTFCWLFSAVLSVSGHKYMWASQYVRSRTGRLLLARLQVAEEENQDIDTTSVSADCKHPTGFPVPLSENIYCTIHHIQYILFLPKSLPLTGSLWYLIFPIMLFCATAVRILLPEVGQICANCKQRFMCVSPRISDQSSTIHSDSLHNDNNWNNWTAWKF